MGRKSKSKAAKPEPAPAPVRQPSPPPAASASDSDDSDYSSDDTVEDEDGTELTPAMDAAILRTLTRIRNKEGVYTGENILGEALKAAEEQAAARGLTQKQAKVEEKPFLLKDLHRANLLSGVPPDSDEEPEEEPLTNVEAERRARKDAVSAFHALVDSDDEEEVFVKREKDAETREDEDAAYRAFLLEMGGGEDAVRQALGIADAPVTHYREDVESDAEGEEEAKGDEGDDKEEKKDRKDRKAKKEESAADKEKREAERRAKRAQADEDFLMDYILNRGWIEKDKKDVPTYEEIVGRAKSDSEAEGGDKSDSDSDDEDDDKAHPWGKLEDEDEFDEAAEEFEHTYNFRFEEPGAGTIATHPRQIDTLVRREDDKRKTKRELRAERKAAEKAAKEEETKRLKGAKRREMESMLTSLKEELGDYVDWEQVEKIMDGDFDEEEWERVVGAMLQAKADREEGIGEDDDEKPTWDDDMGDYGDGDEDAAGGDDGWVEPTRWEDTEEYAAVGEDEDPEDFNMDADYIGLDDDTSSSKKKSKKDKKAKKAEKRAAEQLAAASSLSFEERAAKLKSAAEELNALHGEDMIGDLRTRFKYTKSAPVSFGLTPAEILMATDAELNEVVSVKMLAPYRRGGLGIAGRGLGKRVRELKNKVRERKWGDEMPAENKKKGKDKKTEAGGGGANATPLGDGRKGKRLGKKERQKLQKAAEAGEGAPEAKAAAAPPQPTGGKRKREDEPAPAAAPSAPAGERADGEGKKKRRKKKKGGDAGEA